MNIRKGRVYPEKHGLRKNGVFCNSFGMRVVLFGFDRAELLALPVAGLGPTPPVHGASRLLPVRGPSPSPSTLALQLPTIYLHLRCLAHCVEDQPIDVVLFWIVSSIRALMPGFSPRPFPPCGLPAPLALPPVASSASANSRIASAYACARLKVSCRNWNGGCFCGNQC